MPITNDALKKMAESLSNPDNLEQSSGHQRLLDDIAYLATETAEYQFHDFKNTKYPAPKVALVNLLETLAKRTREGKYDN